MNRRGTLLALLALGATTAPLRAGAQTPVRRIGVVLPNPAFAAADSGMGELRKRLATFGWVEGRNLDITIKDAGGSNERFAALTQELLAQKVELIVTMSTPGALAAKAATSTIPVVFALVADPVGSGLAASLPHPGGNLTGISNLATELAPKQLEILRAIAPRLRRVGFLFDPTVQVARKIGESVKAAAERAGLLFVWLEAQTSEAIEPAFGRAAHEQVTAIVVPPASLYVSESERIARLARKHRIATVHQNREAVSAGALMSYGIDFIDGFARAAGYVDRILKGARPADLPVEQADRFEFAINRGTARALGLTIPQSVLLRADRVIE